MDHQRGDLIEQVAGQRGAQAQVFEEGAEAAQPVRGLEQLAAQVGRAAGHRPAAGVVRGDLLCQAGVAAGIGQVGQHVAGQLFDRAGGAQRTGRAGLRVVVPLVVGAELRQITHVHVCRQAAQVGHEIVLRRRRLEADEPHIQPQRLRGVRDARDVFLPERQRHGNPIGRLTAGESGTRTRSRESMKPPQRCEFRSAYCVFVVLGRIAVSSATARNTHHAPRRYTLNVLNRFPLCANSSSIRLVSLKSTPARRSTLHPAAPSICSVS